MLKQVAEVFCWRHRRYVSKCNEKESCLIRCELKEKKN